MRQDLSATGTPFNHCPRLGLDLDLTWANRKRTHDENHSRPAMTLFFLLCFVASVLLIGIGYGMDAGAIRAQVNGAELDCRFWRRLWFRLWGPWVWRWSGAGSGA